MNNGCGYSMISGSYLILEQIFESIIALGQWKSCQASSEMNDAFPIVWLYIYVCNIYIWGKIINGKFPNNNKIIMQIYALLTYKE